MDSKILTYGLIGLVLLALIFGLGYWIGFKASKPTVTSTTATFEGSPDTVTTVQYKTDVAYVYVDSTTEKPRVVIDTTITKPEITIRLHSDDIFAKGIEVDYKITEKIIYITKTDTLTKTVVVELPKPFYDSFEFGLATGATITAVIAWIITRSLK